MNIFITGGTGFIGRYVVQKLVKQKCHKLLILTRNPNKAFQSENVFFLRGNLENINKWRSRLMRFKPDAAIHLAWEGIPDFSYEKCLKNLKMGLDLFELAAKTGCKTILVSGSLWEYGEKSGKLSEDMPVIPQNAFTAAKNSLNWMGQEIAKNYNMNFLWTRIFYVYGPGQKETSLIPYLIGCAKNGIRPKIRNPNAKNDFVYVEDVAEAIVELLINYNQSGLFNLGTGKLTSVEGIIKKISSSLKKELKFKQQKRNHMDLTSHSYADISKLKKKIGWKPKIDIDEGLKKTIAHLSSK